ncbi:uncharacterized protein BJ212DRAFT_1483141 [Suillus subaureus]|uniref:FAD-binding domain-containing protein n=1 Tax=Suillus subaureus TaxID=48587 RepID=A0A9P7JBB7_9AGAM|nr:uncharacterized protein BJ212DRAFT_1483141 [Suillus subaureus]KAG1812528.1 hypothetical protein BJ212DRAFT_1483141 [Suillus subaureus]
MNSTRPPVLVVGAGPAGLVAALTLLQNGIPVRIIDKDLNPRMGQHGAGPGIWPRSFELFNFLNVPEVNDVAKPFPEIRSYKPGTLEFAIESSIVPLMEPTPAIPFHAAKLIDQQLLDVILRRYLEEYSCSVEMGTELCSVEQSNEGVTAVLAKDGILETSILSVVRKQLGLTFLGEARDDLRMVMGDIRLKGVDLDRAYWYRSGNLKRGISLRPTDEIGEDGWHFSIFGGDLGLTMVAQSEELIFEIIASLILTEITFNKLVWVSKVNIRMVNKLSEGRGFVMLLSVYIFDPILAKLILTYFQCPRSNRWSGLNLGWKLALLEKGLADKYLLETYNAERLPVVSEMLGMATTILNQTLKTGNWTVLRSPILFMLGINYRFSNIVLDEFAIPGKPINAYGVLDEEHLEAGDRAPDALNVAQVGGGESDVKRLCDATLILNTLEVYDESVIPSAVVLPSSASVTSVASSANLVLVDQERHAYSAYLVESGQMKMFVIRLDGAVGAIVHGTEGVKKYFSRIFLGV